MFNSAMCGDLQLFRWVWYVVNNYFRGGGLLKKLRDCGAIKIGLCGGPSTKISGSSGVVFFSIAVHGGGGTEFYWDIPSAIPSYMYTCISVYVLLLLECVCIRTCPFIYLGLAHSFFSGGYLYQNDAIMILFVNLFLIYLRPVFSYKLRYPVNFGLVEMFISTNPKPTMYRNLYENTDPCVL